MMLSETPRLGPRLPRLKLACDFVVALLIRFPNSASVGWRSELTVALAPLTVELVMTRLAFK